MWHRRGRDFSSQVDVYGDNLYCFIENQNEEGQYCIRCSVRDIDTMEEVADFDISDYGKSPEYTYMKNDILYMPIRYTGQDEACGTLLRYDTKTGKLDGVDLEYVFAIQILYRWIFYEIGGNIVVNSLYIIIAVELIAAIVFCVLCIKSQRYKIVKGALLIIMGIISVILGSGLFPSIMWEDISGALFVAGVVLIIIGSVFIIKEFRGRKVGRG